MWRLTGYSESAPFAKFAFAFAHGCLRRLRRSVHDTHRLWSLYRMALLTKGSLTRPSHRDDCAAANLSDSRPACLSSAVSRSNLARLLLEPSLAMLARRRSWDEHQNLQNDHLARMQTRNPRASPHSQPKPHRFPAGWRSY